MSPSAGAPSSGGVVIGVPSETKDSERRVAVTPSAAQMLLARGHRVVVQRGAGSGAGIPDSAFEAVGAQLEDTAAAVWRSDVIVKVKEPQPAEYDLLHDGLVLFAFLHLAAERELTEVLVERGVRAYAFETVRGPGGLPLLAPMSEIAGRAAAIVGASRLSSATGGSGTLAGGAAGVPPARAVVIGLGVAGTMAARGLRGLDAHVTGVDVDLGRLYQHRLDGVVDATQVSEPDAIGSLVEHADLVIGAALVPGARAPVVVDEDQVTSMRAGSVVVDLAIDQGGCVATSRPTSLSEPTFVTHGVVHYCVTNVPGQYPRTASAALSAAVAPRLLALARSVTRGEGDPEELDGALNVAGGRILHPAVAAAFDGTSEDG